MCHIHTQFVTWLSLLHTHHDCLFYPDRQEKSKQQRMSRKSLPATPTQATREGSKEGSDGGERETKTSAASSKVNRETIERLSMPKHVRNKVDGKDKPEAAATQATSKTDTVKVRWRFAFLSEDVTIRDTSLNHCLSVNCLCLRHLALVTW